MRISVIVNTLFSGSIVVLWEGFILRSSPMYWMSRKFSLRAKPRFCRFQIHIPSYQGGEGIKSVLDTPKIIPGNL